MAAVESVRYVHIVLLTLFLGEAQEPGLKISIPSLRGKRAVKKRQLLIHYTFPCTFCWIPLSWLPTETFHLGSSPTAMRSSWSLAQ